MKKLLALVIAVVFTVSVVGCSSPTSAPKPPPAPTGSGSGSGK